MFSSFVALAAVCVPFRGGRRRLGFLWWGASWRSLGRRVGSLGFGRLGSSPVLLACPFLPSSPGLPSPASPLLPPLALRACLRSSPLFVGVRPGTGWPVCAPPCAVCCLHGLIDGFCPPQVPLSVRLSALGGLASRVPTRGEKCAHSGETLHFDVVENSRGFNKGTN